MANAIGAATALETLSGWQAGKTDRDEITKTFKFDDFQHAFAFMTAVAIRADKMDHHPEWSNVYNRVDVTLTTHDADGVTALDVELATFMDTLADRLS